MGKLIVKGYGNDIGDANKFYAIIVAFGIVALIVSFIFIGAISDYHTVGSDSWGRPSETIRGIRFSDWVLRTNYVRFIIAIVIVGFAVRHIRKYAPKFNSEVSVFEGYVRGISANKEIFELQYNEISSVHSQDTSVNINAGGKVYQVYATNWMEIITEINKRRFAINAIPNIIPEVPENIECSKCSKMYHDSYNSCPYCGYRPSGVKPTLSTIAAKPSSKTDGFWICSKCSEKNLSIVRNCKGCGKDK